MPIRVKSQRRRYVECRGAVLYSTLLYSHTTLISNSHSVRPSVRQSINPPPTHSHSLTHLSFPRYLYDGGENARLQRRCSSCSPSLPLLLFFSFSFFFFLFPFLKFVHLSLPFPSLPFLPTYSYCIQGRRLRLKFFAPYFLFFSFFAFFSPSFLFFFFFNLTHTPTHTHTHHLPSARRRRRTTVPHFLACIHNLGPNLVEI